MPIDVPTLLIGIAMTLAAPVIAAALYNERRAIAKIVGSISDTVNNLQSKQGRQELSLEWKYGKDYRSISKQVSILTSVLEASTTKENHLKMVLLDLTKKGESLRKLADKKPNARTIATMLNWRITRAAEVEKELWKQELLVKEQQDQLEKLKEKCEGLLVQKEVLIAKETQKNANDAAFNVLLRCTTTAHRDIFERMESKVKEKEEEALENFRPIVRQAQSIEIERLTAQIELTIQKFESKLSSAQDNLTTLDPNIERAYDRLRKQQLIAIGLAERSLQEEDRFEKNIKVRETNVEALQNAADNAAKKGNRSLADRLPGKLSENNSRREDLTVALRAHRLRNLALQHRLFRIEGIIKRLYLNQLMLSALPNKKSDLFSQYQSISSAALLYLNGEGHSKSANADDEFDLPTRLSALESRTQLALIVAVKDEFQKLLAAASLHSENEILDIWTRMKAEKVLHESEFEKWKAIANQSLEEGKELMHAVSSSREKQYAEIIGVIEQNAKVLAIAVECLPHNR
jgi:hypothetical protein